MPSTSVSQPAPRHAPLPRHRGTVQLYPSLRRPAHQTSHHAGNEARPLAAAARLPSGRLSLAERRAQLEARWRDRLERITALALAYHDEADCPALDAAGAAGESRRAQLLAHQAAAERQALAEIEAALERLSSGQYGRCEQCGRPIAEGLLTAQPAARYCPACGRQAAGRRPAYA